MGNLKNTVVKHINKEATINKKASEEYIYSPIKYLGIYRDDEDEMLKKLANITGETETVDFWIDTNQSYIKWVLHLIDNGIGGVILDPIIKEIKVVGTVQASVIDAKQEYGVQDVQVENVEIPVSLDNVEVDLKVEEKTIALHSIDWYEDKLEIEFWDKEI